MTGTGRDRRTADRVEVRGLEMMLICGVLPQERIQSQPFRFDLDLYADLTVAGESDGLADTVNYGQVVDLLSEQLPKHRFELLERLASEVATIALGIEKVAAVTVTVHKLRPPVEANLASTGVRIHRNRER